MSYRLVVLGDLPLAFWRLDETTGTTLADASGQGYTGTIASTPVLNQPGLVKGSRSVKFNALARFTAVVPDIMVAGQEAEAFALECWVKVDAPPTVARPVMMRNTNSGLYITPGGVEFRALSSDGTIYTAYYTVTDWNEPLHIIGNYVGRNLGLIVNAQEGTNSDFNGSFSSTTSTFYVGGTTTTVSLSLNLDAPAIYRKPLSIETATRHYDYGRTAFRPLDISQVHGGGYYSLDDDSAVLLWEYTEGQILESGTFDSDLEYLGGFTNIAGSRIDWDASTPVSVQVSLNKGTTWTNCTNHAEIPGIGANATLTDKFVMFRKIIPTNATYQPRLESLRVVIYQTKTSKSNLSGLTLGVTGNPVLAESATSAMEGDSNMGAKLVKTDYYTIPGRAEGIATISMWFRRDALANSWSHVFDAGVASTPAQAALRFDPTNVVASNGATFYINGVAKTPDATDFPLGVWVHVLAVFTTATVGDVLLNAALHARTESGFHSFAHVTVYPTALDARTARVVYGMQVGLVNTTVLDSAAFTVVEVPLGIKAYSFAWSSVQNGIS